MGSRPLATNIGISIENALLTEHNAVNSVVTSGS
jgi:hypothetical protein